MRPEHSLDWLRRHGVATLTPAGGLASLVEAVTSGSVKGSWWGHPQGHRVHACSVALTQSGEALATKLVAGKVTFVHRRLWPALYRAATDPSRRQAQGLEVTARRLLAAVHAAGELRLDHYAVQHHIAGRALRPPRELLERRLLVQSGEVHTEQGRHTTVLRSWEHWAPADVRSAAAQMSLEEARAALRSACCGAASALD